MFFISDNDIDYRIDSDEDGCIIRGNGKFIEGNEIVYQVLVAYNKGGIPNIKEEIRELYQSSEDDISILCSSLADIFEQEGILSELLIKLRNNIG